MAWLTARPEDHIAVVAHGGLLAVLFDGAYHGGHTTAAVRDPDQILAPRFKNCEVRTVQVETDLGEEGGPRYTIIAA